MHCPFCHAPMLEGARFCDECGRERELPDGSTVSPVAPRGTGKLSGNKTATAEPARAVRTVQPPEGKDVEHDVSALLGAGSGEMGISLDRHRYAPGDVVRGELLLRLGAPAEATRLLVGVMALREQAALYRSELTLRERGSFEQGQYSFEVTLPRTLPAAEVRWELFCLLEIPGRLPVQRRIRLAVR